MGDVASASLAFHVPMTYLANGGTVHVEGQPTPPGTQPPASFLNHVGHEYFDTMQIPIVRGRAFTRDEEDEIPMTRRLAIVNEAMAERYWPGQDRSQAVRSRGGVGALRRSQAERAGRRVRPGVREAPGSFSTGPPNGRCRAC